MNREQFCVLEGSLSFYTFYFHLVHQVDLSFFLTAQIACTCAVVCTQVSTDVCTGKLSYGLPTI